MVNDTPKPVILAVDDTPENLDVVKGILVGEYTVKVAVHGKVALKIAESQSPDLILLDIMMPEIDGYEVCRQLKANPATRDIPVIFLTAKGETADEAEGFNLGAADYILKPVNPPLLKARVKTHLALKQNMNELQAAYAVINEQKQRMQQELNVGRDIQMSMVPDTFPAFPDRDEFDIHALLLPAREIGGDFYDYFFVDRNKLCICVGDVSGKGVPAALFMAVAKTMIKSTAVEDHSPASIITRVNDEISVDNPSSMFITLFLGMLDVITGEFRYTNAGHPYPYIKRSDGRIDTLLKLHGPVVGAVDGLAYGEESIYLEKNDQLLIFTDGITEAMDPIDQLYGEPRVVELFESVTTADPKSLVAATLASVEAFAGTAEQADDITILAVTYLADAQAETSQHCEITIVNQLTEIDRVNDSFNELAEQCGIPMPLSFRVNMVFDELLANIISHAYTDEESHSIEIDITCSNDKLSITISDDGAPFNPFTREDPDITLSLDDREIGGLGIHLVKNAMDETIYQRRHNRNVVILIKNISE
ncbi:MAG: sigma-B regulation protein RsbU (phosphoserine phosphatase) [Candidatus Azotimanducaceae bacterium]|jgi:sigma-B regulation protein RsbU (phosphoserine phosphatase)